MAKINYDSFQGISRRDDGNLVQFFSLKNDGDEATVRIMCDSTNDFDIFVVHPLEIGGKYRKINCLRSASEPLTSCPFCATKQKIQQRIFIRILQYVKDENGAINVVPKIWERSASYVPILKSLLDEYGPLSDSIFKIKRSGAAGSIDTTYSILFGNPAVYRADLYPKKEELFKNYSVLGHVVSNKTAEEMNTFLSTGEFSAIQSKSENTSSSNNVSTESSTSSSTQNQTSTTNTFETTDTTGGIDFSTKVVSEQKATTRMPWEVSKKEDSFVDPFTSAGGVQRPTRTY